MTLFPPCYETYDSAKGIAQVAGGEVMGRMKDFDRRIRQGGDDAIAAVNEYVSGVEGWLKSFAALTKQVIPQWVPVSERLPEPHHHVIGWQPGFARTAEVWIGSSGQWLGGDFEPAGDITHWMPLPEPPEVK